MEYSRENPPEGAMWQHKTAETLFYRRAPNTLESLELFKIDRWVLIGALKTDAWMDENHIRLPDNKKTGLPPEQIEARIRRSDKPGIFRASRLPPDPIPPPSPKPSPFKPAILGLSTIATDSKRAIWGIWG